MKHLFQPKRSHLCGQTSVAMVAGISLEESIKAFKGHKKATTFKLVTEALDNLGYDTGDIKIIDNRKKNQIFPDLCLIRIEKVGKNLGHLVVYNKGKVYDPAEGVFESKDDFIKYYKQCNSRYRIRQYYEVTKRDNDILIDNTNDLTMVAGDMELESNKVYMVTLSHRLFKEKDFIKRKMTKVEIERIKLSDKFKLEKIESI